MRQQKGFATSMVPDQPLQPYIDIVTLLNKQQTLELLQLSIIPVINALFAHAYSMEAISVRCWPKWSDFMKL